MLSEYVLKQLAEFRAMSPKPMHAFVNVPPGELDELKEEMNTLGYDYVYTSETFKSGRLNVMFTQKAT
jgi:hypothetical protein